MPIIPVRELAAKGILRDPSPYQLDMPAWSAGAGVRFHANTVDAAPIWRLVEDSLSATPVFCVGYEPSTGYDLVTVASSNGQLWQYGSGAVTNVTQNLNTPVITVAGTGYNPASPPTVTFAAAPGGGVTATGVALVSPAGHVTGIAYTNWPKGYLTAPAITIAAPGSGTTATATVTLFATNTDPRAVNSTYLGDVQYINRPDAAPRFYGPESTSFLELPNMECAWTCRSLRAFGDYLIALNVTKPTTFVDPYSGLTLAGGPIPNLFKWSDLALDGQVPDSWDPDDPTKSTGENPLEQIDTPLVDGLPMRGAFMIYSETAVWSAYATGDNNIFGFSEVFDTGGLLAPNCVVEVDGIHYCFGPTDIYKHDGVQKVSIIDKRNKKTLYRNLTKQLSEVCFTAYLPSLDSVLFAYNTGDPTAFFTNCGRCNQGAIYDLNADTWTFIDLPNISAVTQANLDTVLTWATCPSTMTWSNVGGSWFDQQNSFVKSAVAVSGSTQQIANSRILAYDFMNLGILVFPYAPDCNTPAFVERTGISLDALGSDLTTYKRLKRVYPQVTLYDPNSPLQIQIGYANTPSGAVTWGAPATFNPSTGYKVDTITGGRYLGIRFTASAPADFAIAGYDMEITDGGKR